MKFTVTLFFVGHVPCRFATTMASAMRAHSQRDIDYDVLRTEVISGREVRLYLDIQPTRFAAAITDAQMRRSGIAHPARSRATTAAMLWIASLYDTARSPLSVAWTEFCGSRQTPMPFTLFTYDVSVTPPIKDGGRAVVLQGPPPPTKNVTVDGTMGHRAKHDGTPQTPARV
jgi:hypothetical protein